jgi:hypothetical protein
MHGHGASTTYLGSIEVSLFGKVIKLPKLLEHWDAFNPYLYTTISLAYNYT